MGWAWRQVHADGGPGARSSHTVNYHDGKVLVWGGERASRTPTDSVLYVYDDAHPDQWSQQDAPNAPTPRIAPAAAVVGGRLLICGGRTGVEMGEGSLNDLHDFDLGSGQWEVLQPRGGTAPAPRSYHAGEAADGAFYIFGGCGESGRLSDLWRFDPRAGEWHQLPAAPAIKGRGGAGLAALDGSLYLVGGFSGQEQGDMHRFDLAAAAWDCPADGSCAEAAPLPARSIFALAAAPGLRLVLFGGEVDPSATGHAAAGDFSGDALLLDAGAPPAAWRLLEAAGVAPCARGWTAGAATGRGLVLHGGLSNQSERLGDTFFLEEV